MLQWTYKNIPFTKDMIDGHYGFVYLITNLITGQLYVGRKYFVRKDGKKWRESDWENYAGSSEVLKESISSLGENNFKREILHLCLTRGNTNYTELSEQFKRDVLGATTITGEYLYYNSNIASRYFRSTVRTAPDKILLHKKKNQKLLDGKPIAKKKLKKTSLTIKPNV